MSDANTDPPIRAGALTDSVVNAIDPRSVSTAADAFTVTRNNTLAVGEGAKSKGDGAVAVGQGVVSGDGGNPDTVVGTGATGPSSQGINGAVVIGNNAGSNSSSHDGAVMIGDGADINDGNGVAIGVDAEVDGSGVSIGSNATNDGNSQVVAIGASATVGPGATAIGWSTDTGTGSNGIVIGNSAVINNDVDGAIAIGQGTSVGVDDAGRVGVDQLVFGAVPGTLSDGDLNDSEITFELDETNNDIVAKIQDSDGGNHDVRIGKW